MIMTKRHSRPNPDTIKWRTSNQIGGVAAQIKGAIIACDDGAYVTIDIKNAHNLHEICMQAMHTEVGHEHPDEASKMHLPTFVRG